jgi:hypothetical protein
MNVKACIPSGFHVPLEINIAPLPHTFENPAEKSHGTQINCQNLVELGIAPVQ